MVWKRNSHIHLIERLTQHLARVEGEIAHITNEMDRAFKEYMDERNPPLLREAELQNFRHFERIGIQKMREFLDLEKRIDDLIWLEERELNFEF